MRLVNFLATGSLKCRWNCDGSKSCVKAYLPSFFQYNTHPSSYAWK